jgi:2-oxo-3-hexenedioate decarboxylase
MKMEVNGKVVTEGNSEMISGDPVNSLVELCRLLDDRGLYVPAGSIVLAGAPTQALQLEPGMEVRLRVDTLGDVSVKVSA